MLHSGSFSPFLPTQKMGLFYSFKPRSKGQASRNIYQSLTAHAHQTCPSSKRRLVHGSIPSPSFLSTGIFLHCPTSKHKILPFPSLNLSPRHLPAHRWAQRHFRCIRTREPHRSQMRAFIQPPRMCRSLCWRAWVSWRLGDPGYVGDIAEESPSSVASTDLAHTGHMTYS